MTKYLATDLVVGTLVGISLLMCICFGETSLAGNIASGLIGYLGRTITVNARLDSEGCIVTEGAQLLLGGNDRYLAMCHKCWIRNIREHRKVKNR